MRCEDTLAKFVDYLTGTLAESERNEVEDHLASCPACHAEVESLSETWERLAEVPAIRPDSAGMRARFDALLADSASEASRVAISAQAQSTHSTERPPTAPPVSRTGISSWLRRNTSLQPLLQGCAALLILAIGIQLGSAIRPSSTSEVRELSQEVRNLRQMVTLSLMQQGSASERLKGVSWSNQLDRPGNEVVNALIEALMHDSNVNVRLASIDALKRFADREVVRTAATHALDTQSSPLVQMALIDFVVETQDRGALDTLRRLSRDNTVNATVRTRAAWGIGHLEAV
jgi:HEAT repeats/Putative zinc-finger